MPHNDLVRSEGFTWAAEGHSPRTLAEMRRFLAKFEAVPDADGRHRTTATRADIEQVIASLPTPPMRHDGWRSLRSSSRFLSEDHEVPNPAAKIAPSVPSSCDGPSRRSGCDVLDRAGRWPAPWPRHHEPPMRSTTVAESSPRQHQSKRSGGFAGGAAHRPEEHTVPQAARIVTARRKRCRSAPRVTGQVRPAVEARCHASRR
jgi:hypothetical protein